MIKNWWKSQIGFKEICGVEFVFLEDGNINCQISSLKLHKNTINLISQKTDLIFDEAIKEIKLIKVPLAINLSGVLVLTRIVPLSNSDDETSIAFPGMEKEKFYIQRIAQKNSVVISLVNKKSVDSILQYLNSNNILNISLAGLSPLALLSQIDTENQQLAFANHQLSLVNNDLYKYQFSEKFSSTEPIHFNGLKINSQLFNAYAQAFQVLLYPLLVPIGTEYSITEIALSYRKNTLKTSALIFLSFAFLILCINFLVWNHLNQKNIDLESQMIFSKTMESDRDSLLSNITIKEEAIKSLGIIPIPHQQIYLRIGNAVPVNVQLTAIEINPSITDSLEYGQVIVKGIMANVKDYETFKTNLINLQTFSVLSESFGYLENKKTNIFELKLQMFE
jgi:hypothetical protein